MSGEFFASTDEKGRIRIPSKLKSALSDGVSVTKGTNGCLFLFSKKEWHEGFAKKLAGVPVSDIGAQMVLRSFFLSSAELEEDAQGRSLLPKNLREFAGIKKEIVFIGVGNRAELWAKEVYEGYFSGKIVKNTENYDKMIAELNRYGI